MNKLCTEIYNVSLIEFRRLTRGMTRVHAYGKQTTVPINGICDVMVCIRIG